MSLKIEHGGFTMVFEPETGFVRKIRYGDQELVRAIYATVRDENWATLRHELLSVHQFERSLTWRHRCWKGDVAYLEFDGELTWDDKRVKYHVVGRPLIEYQTARTGLCLLHPREQDGRAVTITHPSGAQESGQFPTTIVPKPPFTDITAMSLDLDELKVGIHFHGEEFETEDQRNWMDASFKTYCWPQHRGWPYSVGPDQLIEHAVDITVDGPGEPAVWPVASLDWENALTTSLPILGTVIHGEAPELTSVLGAGMVIATGDMDQLVADLEVAEESGLLITLHIQHAWTRAMMEFIANPQIITRVQLDLNYASQRAEVEASFPDVAIFLASSQNFTELNGYSGDRANWAGVAFAGNPQVHAFDALSITETPSTLADQIRSAEPFNDGLVSVGPLMFEPSHWNERPADPRILDDIYAAWVLGCFISATASGAYSVVIGETAGGRGFWQNEQLSIAGQVMKSLGEMEGEVRIAVSSDSTLIMGIENNGRRMIAHLGSKPRVESIDSAP